LVSANISLVTAAIDPQTKAFSDPHSAIKKEIENLRADKTIPGREKKQLFVELNEGDQIRAAHRISDQYRASEEAL
jgi:hypothetical protein